MEIINLNVYTKKALELFRTYFTDSSFYSHPGNFMQASDNEVIYKNLPATGKKFLVDKQRIIERMKMAIRMYPANDELYILVHAISDSKKAFKCLIKKFGKERIESIVGRPLDPFKANAIEILENKIDEVKKEFDDKIDEIKKKRNKIVSELREQMNNLRNG